MSRSHYGSDSSTPQVTNLGTLLLRKGKVTREVIEDAVKRQPTDRKALGQLLIESGKISDEDLLEALAEQFGYPIANLAKVEHVSEAVPPFNIKFLRQQKFFPIEYERGKLHIAVADPLDFYTLDNLELALGCRLGISLATEQSIDEAIERLYGEGAATVESIIEDMAEENIDILGSEEVDDIDLLRDMAQEAPVVKLVNLVINEAIDRRASDIHFEPLENEMRVRYRIDGVLFDAQRPPRKLVAAIISRVKIMAEMNIAERRLPQDGRIRLKIGGRRIDLRVSTVPTVYGESVVMRILDRSTVFLSLDQLGFERRTLTAFESLVKRPHGIILVSGPTGSGKTTTLYGALDKINSAEKKIITVEDPVEYQLKGINQIHVKPKIGLTFASGLRSIVRQDPDVIMIGEIRDVETAEIAIQSALTGHLVFSTIHTNDAPSTVARLVDMGVEPYMVASCLEAVLAQRLVRMICQRCKTPVRPPRELFEQLGVLDEVTPALVIYEGTGCPDCDNTGYRSRAGIYELLVIDDRLRDMITAKIPAAELRKYAISQGMRTLRQDGWDKVKKGETSIHEVLRMTQDETMVLAAE
ncbi:MAG: type II secretion system ATPase GspE [Candidatus Schekmanbacteria bacterium]|nr:type II secretion system ATPase GspE [Candidatus Schekmanbacteria bacterium]